MRKTVGVMPLWDDDRESVWMLPGYLDGIAEAGGLPVIFPLDIDREGVAQLCSMCDGFLFTGGQDVSPEMYGETPLDDLVYTCKRRDDLEKLVLDFAIKHDRAVLGICRGIQFINAAMGGTLYQDLPSQRPSGINHRMTAPYDGVCHYVDIVAGSELFVLLEVDRLGVNSCHHQAVKDVAPGLEVMAVSEDGIVEAVRIKDRKFIWAVQWHPEFSHKSDENSRKIFSEFIAHC